MSGAYELEGDGLVIGDCELLGWWGQTWYRGLDQTISFGVGSDDYFEMDMVVD